VAVDGPAGTGKSTVARRLAASLGARYLDTGAMYRAAALGVLRADVDPTEPAAVREAVARRHIQVGTEPATSRVLLDGEDVSGEIRGPEVTTAVSPVSAVSGVRVLLVAQQRRIIAEAADVAKSGGAVHLRVTGHTDTVGSARYNLKLSQRRAVAVKRQLMADGVPGTEIATLGVGKTDLLVPTPDGVREPQNRRVEITFGPGSGQ